jgi:hypothetical protein
VTAILLRLFFQCLGIECPTEIAVFELDRKFKEWEARLSPEFRWNGDLSQSRDPFIIRQSYILATWYIACRMKLHLSFVTQPERAPSHSVALKQSRDKCIELSMELVRLQNQRYAAYMDARRKEALPRVNWSFEGSFSLFDGAVSLVTALAHTPAKERRKDAEELVEEAKAVLSHVVVDGLGCAGEVSRMAAGVLHVLGQEGIWRSEGSGNENLSITESSEPPLYAQRWFQAPSPSRAISKQTPEDTFSKPHPSVFLSRSGWPSSLRPLYTTLLA